MRRGWVIAATILVVLALVGIGVGAYNAGLDTGIRRAADAGQVVEVVGPGYGWHGGGFFPFGFILFPLFVIGIFLLIGSAFRGPRGWGHGYRGPGPWGEEGRARFEDRFDEWHRRQHDETPAAPDRGGGSG